MHRNLTSHDPEATVALAAALGRALPAGVTLALDGDLGAGKTTFVRGLAAGLGIDEGVASPTYTLMQSHDGGRLPLYHFDAWMEGREKAFLADGADELLGRDGVAVVEWADRVGEWLPRPRLSVRLAHLDVERRRIRIEVVVGAEEAGPGPLQGALEALLGSLELPEGVVEDAPGRSENEETLNRASEGSFRRR
ncbi:MAG: tRNA (adenosine(37)-N6)-threonylcarbamoyltransferase complex ATPase subunit type 1 TsaE [Planctomycetota bacterium]